MVNTSIKIVRLCFVMIVITLQSSAQNLDYSSLLTKKTLVTKEGCVPMWFVNCEQLNNEGWSELPQPKFWLEVIQMSSDSMLVNVASERRPLYKVCTNEWSCYKECDKDIYKDSVRALCELDYDKELYVTVGKREFYEIRKAVPQISRAVNIFNENGVDPWYAQAILLIESPGKFHAKSNVGACGPFQLMPYVAKKYGLKVSKKMDERTNIDRAAYAASQLLGRSFIPMTKKMLDTLNIEYKETDLWFRLLVLHSYHAGPGNVKAVLNKINPSEGSIALLKTMWQTEAGGFKNQSQNYSQIALATQLAFDKIVNEDNDSVFLIQGDRAMELYKSKSYQCSANEFLSIVMSKYESDLIDGLISADYFTQQSTEVRKQLSILNGDTNNLATHPYKEKELNALGNQLLKKRNVNDAIKVFEMNVDAYPGSPNAYDSLGTAYRMSGQIALAEKQFNKSAELKKKAGVENSQNKP